MAARPQSLVDCFRTIVWMDRLINQLGTTHTALDRLYFEKYVSCFLAADEQAGESDRRFRRYFEGKNVPRPDPVIAPNQEGSGWEIKLDPLRAMEQEAPGSARWFFHPLFNLLDGRIHSSEAIVKWMRERRDPGGELFDEVFKMLISGWERSLRREGKREPPACFSIGHEKGSQFSIQMVREEMLRLEGSIVSAFFQEKDGQLYRRPSPVTEEVEFLAMKISLDHLTAAIGLYIEAQLLGALDRIDPIAALIEHQLPSLDEEANFKRVSEKLAIVIRDGFGARDLLGYSRLAAEVNGFPASWGNYIRNVSASMAAII